ncbi:MAG: YitT family protein [Clostridia bacterium]
MGKITAGTFLLAAALNIFFEPHGIITGGVTGIGILLKELSERFCRSRSHCIFPILSSTFHF